MMRASGNIARVGTVVIALIVTTGCGGPAVPTTSWDHKPDLTGVWEGTALSAEAYGLAALAQLYQPAAMDKSKALTAKDDPTNECVPYGSPRHQAKGLPFQIIQSIGSLTILTDQPHIFRFIQIEGRQHQEDVFPTTLGDPVGRWEGDTVVVDITSYNGRTWLAGAKDFPLPDGAGGLITSEALHVVERWRLLDANTLEYQATVEDPDVLTQPWTTPKITYKRSAQRQIGEGFCIPPAIDFEAPALRKADARPLASQGREPRRPAQECFMTHRLLGVLLTSAVLFGGPAVQAHHSFSVTFDIDKPLTVEGTVVAVRWTNPHTMIDVEAKDARGQVLKWTFESLPPGVLFRKGLTRARLKAGASVTMTGHLARRTPQFAEVSLIQFMDGEAFCVPASGSTKVCDVEER